MKKKEKWEIVYRELERLFPNPTFPLNYGTEFQLCVAVILSARCTDKKVNEVTGKLFKKVKTPQDFVNISQKELEKAIYSTGFYSAKAKNIKALAQKIQDDYKGSVPLDIDILVTLPGIGRKTANVIISEATGASVGFVVDTHVIRFVDRFGLVVSKNPIIIERELMEIVPQKEWRRASLRIVFYGRSFGKAEARGYIQEKDPLVKALLS
jgi:endonuclease-3